MIQKIRIPLLLIICTIQSPLIGSASEEMSVDQQIETLENELKSLRKDAFNKEMDAQPKMFDNWDEYAQEIEANEEDEKQILKIKQQLKDLKARKEALPEGGQ